MTITIYLTRLLAAFFFVGIIAVDTFALFLWISKDWRIVNTIQVIIVDILALALSVGAAYFLWVIK